MEELLKASINYIRRDIIEKIVASYMEYNQYDEAKIRKRIDTMYYGAFQHKAMNEAKGMEEYELKLEQLFENYKNSNDFNAIIEEVLSEYR